MERHGVLKSWNDEKGFGFIQPDDGNQRVFVHISVVRGEGRPSLGQRVLFVSKVNQQGRLLATHMRSEELAVDRPATRRKPVAPAPAKAAPPSAKRRRSGPRRRIEHVWPKLLIWLALCSLPLLGVVMLYLQRGLAQPLLLYPAASLCCYLLYRSDKRLARKGQRRIPENLLHVAELLGGWPGALIAQQRYRHKTRKLSYQVPFWLIVVAHQLLWIDQLLLDGLLLGQWLLAASL